MQPPPSVDAPCSRTERPSSCRWREGILPGLAIGIVALLILAGCQADETTVADSSKAPTEFSATPEQEEAEVVDDTAAATIFTSSAADEVLHEVYVPEEWLAPIAEDETFFAPPEIPVAVQETPRGDDSRPQVRLLGFAVRMEEPDVRKAILKIEGDLCFLSDGEEHAGVRVVSMERHAVHLEHEGNRWHLVLHEQPLVNVPEQVVKKERDRKRGHAFPDDRSRTGYSWRKPSKLEAAAEIPEAATWPENLSAPLTIEPPVPPESTTAASQEEPGTIAPPGLEVVEPQLPPLPAAEIDLPELPEDPPLNGSS
ncbi:MAG: hypothetical protein KatS3mg111_3731 [Pirellulaceae bacterium]|nr:MAG: hypothetical protein KatS3mg111_3731 [Pirellulaceae bacterium]